MRENDGLNGALFPPSLQLRGDHLVVTLQCCHSSMLSLVKVDFSCQRASCQKRLMALEYGGGRQHETLKFGSNRSEQTGNLQFFRRFAEISAPAGAVDPTGPGPGGGLY